MKYQQGYIRRIHIFSAAFSSLLHAFAGNSGGERTLLLPVNRVKIKKMYEMTFASLFYLLRIQRTDAAGFYFYPY